MTDHATDATREELVRAYVDGDLDEPGRAEIEADPGLQADVAAQREVRSALAGSEPPSHATRERAIAAALAVFDAPAAAPVAPPSASLASRRRARWWAPAAAAAIAVVIAGGTIAVLTNDPDDEGSADQETLSDDAGDDAVAPAAPAATSQDESATMTLAATAAAEQEESAAAAAATADAAVPTLASPAELAAFAAGLRSAPMAVSTASAGDEAASATTGQPTTTRLSSCAPDAVALADLVVAGEVRRVVVRVDEARAEAVALDAATCDELQRVPLP